MDIQGNHPPHRMYTSSKHHPPSHYQSKFDRNVSEDCCRRNDFPSTTSLYQDKPGRSHKKYYERDPQIIEPPTNHPSLATKWSRNNIALTMEYFEPISSTSTPKRYSNQPDYSYAYYEPGAVMRHSNIPKMLTTVPQNGVPAPSTQSSPKSIRSLLSKPNDDNAKPNNRHTYTTRYGTQENIYEDVSSIRIQPGRIESSNRSPNNAGSGSKIEFQDILHNHYRVLEELNLSVEEMLLSTTAKPNTLFPRKMLLKRSTKSRPKAKSADGNKSKNIFASSMNELVAGEDSGFSGSSSGASYIGSLRNYKTALTRSHHNSTEIFHLNDVSDCETLQGVANQSRQQRQMVNQLKGDKCSGPTKVLKFPFWRKK